MNLPFRKRSGTQTNPIIPEMNGPVQPSSGSRINWPRVILAVIVGLVILGALIWGSVWEAGRSSNPSKTVATNSKSTQSSKPKQSKAPSKPQTSSGSTSGTSTSRNGSGAAPQVAGDQQKTSTPSQTGSGNLANSGPGDVAAVFLVASVAGAGLYHFILRKRVA